MHSDNTRSQRQRCTVTTLARTESPAYSPNWLRPSPQVTIRDLGSSDVPVDAETEVGAGMSPSVRLRDGVFLSRTVRARLAWIGSRWLVTKRLCPPGVSKQTHACGNVAEDELYSRTRRNGIPTCQRKPSVPSTHQRCPTNDREHPYERKYYIAHAKLNK